MKKFHILSKELSEALIKCIDEQRFTNEIMSALPSRCAEIVRTGDVTEIDPEFMKVIEIERAFWHAHAWPEDFKCEDPLFLYNMGIVHGCITGVYDVIEKHKLQERYEHNINRILKYTDVFEVINRSKEPLGLKIKDIARKTEHSEMAILRFLTDFSDFNFFCKTGIPERQPDGNYHMVQSISITEKGKETLADLRARLDNIEKEGKER